MLVQKSLCFLFAAFAAHGIAAGAANHAPLQYRGVYRQFVLGSAWVDQRTPPASAVALPHAPTRNAAPILGSGKPGLSAAGSRLAISAPPQAGAPPVASLMGNVSFEIDAEGGIRAEVCNGVGFVDFVGQLTGESFNLQSMDAWPKPYGDTVSQHVIRGTVTLVNGQYVVKGHYNYGLYFGLDFQATPVGNPPQLDCPKYQFDAAAMAAAYKLSLNSPLIIDVTIKPSSPVAQVDSPGYAQLLSFVYNDRNNGKQYKGKGVVDELSRFYAFLNSPGQQTITVAGMFTKINQSWIALGFMTHLDGKPMDGFGVQEDRQASLMQVR